MSAGGASQAALGFLSVVEDEQLGLVGGYLLLNSLGRPIEFHCTAPVKPNRAQQILYGPTLRPYLYGEQIGQTLIGKAAVQPLLVCTDNELSLAVRDWVSVPVAVVAREPETPTHSETPDAAACAATVRIDAAHSTSDLLGFAWAGNRLAVPRSCGADRDIIVERLSGLPEFDLVEPFERIRQAIDEAQRTART